MRWSGLIFKRALWFVFAIQCVAVAGQTLKYEPTVGQQVVFGIDCIVNPGTPGQPSRTHRVRLTITPTSLEEDHWQANFSTVPVTASGPLKTRQPLRDPSEYMQAPGLSGPLAESHARLVQSAVEHYKQEVAERRMMPGLVTPIEGTLKIGYDGTIQLEEPVTSLPLMLGSVASIPFALLPKNDDDASYSNKQWLQWTGRDDESELPQAWLINAWSVGETKEGVTHLKRSVEFGSGDNSTLKLDLSGDGKVVFNPEIGLAQSGQFQFQSNQSVYRGRIDKYQMQIAFQLLNDWQLILFDQFMVPNEFALEKENLTRLTPQQCSLLTNLFTHPDASSRSGIDTNSLQMTAPLPVESKLYKVMKQSLDKTDGKDRKISSWFSHDIELALYRWERVRKLGTVVPRTWKASAGSFQIKARMVSADEMTVVLKREDNQQEIKVPLEKLSAEDQEFVKIFGKGPEVTSPP